MAVRGFFYNATDLNDKEHMYNGQDMNEDKAPFYKEGVAYGHLQVAAAGGSMEVVVDGGTRTGYAYINDETERKPSIYVLEGAFSSNPQAPELLNNDVIQEKSLARIYIPAGAVEITQANITDERPDDTVCGFIGSQFEELDFSQWNAQFSKWFSEEKKAMEKDHANFVKQYENLTQGFMNEQAAEWNKWFEEKKTELAGDVAGKLQLQIDDLKTKVHNMAYKVYMEYFLESTTTPVTITLTNTTTGTVQTAEVTKSGIGFYVTEAGEYTVESNMERVMAIPKKFKADNTDLMHTITIALREGTNMAYIGNYIGTYLLKESEEKRR